MENTNINTWMKKQSLTNLYYQNDPFKIFSISVIANFL